MHTSLLLKKICDIKEQVKQESKFPYKKQQISSLLVRFDVNKRYRAIGKQRLDVFCSSYFIERYFLYLLQTR